MELSKTASQSTPQQKSQRSDFAFIRVDWSTAGQQEDFLLSQSSRQSKENHHHHHPQVQHLRLLESHPEHPNCFRSAAHYKLPQDREPGTLHSQRTSAVVDFGLHREKLRRAVQFKDEECRVPVDEVRKIQQQSFGVVNYQRVPLHVNRFGFVCNFMTRTSFGCETGVDLIPLFRFSAPLGVQSCPGAGIACTLTDPSMIVFQAPPGGLVPKLMTPQFEPFNPNGDNMCNAMHLHYSAEKRKLQILAGSQAGRLFEVWIDLVPHSGGDGTPQLPDAVAEVVKMRLTDHQKQKEGTSSSSPYFGDPLMHRPARHHPESQKKYVRNVIFTDPESEPLNDMCVSSSLNGAQAVFMVEDSRSVVLLHRVRSCASGACRVEDRSGKQRGEDAAGGAKRSRQRSDDAATTSAQRQEHKLVMASNLDYQRLVVPSIPTDASYTPSTNPEETTTSATASATSALEDAWMQCQQQRQLQEQPAAQMEQYFTYCAFSDCGNYVAATADRDKLVAVWKYVQPTTGDAAAEDDASAGTPPPFRFPTLQPFWVAKLPTQHMPYKIIGIGGSCFACVCGNEVWAFDASSARCQCLASLPRFAATQQGQQQPATTTTTTTTTSPLIGDASAEGGESVGEKLIGIDVNVDRSKLFVAAKSGIHTINLRQVHSQQQHQQHENEQQHNAAQFSSLREIMRRHIYEIAHENFAHDDLEEMLERGLMHVPCLHGHTMTQLALSTERSPFPLWTHCDLECFCDEDDDDDVDEKAQQKHCFFVRCCYCDKLLYDVRTGMKVEEENQQQQDGNQNVCTGEQNSFFWACATCDFYLCEKCTVRHSAGKELTNLHY